MPLKNVIPGLGRFPGGGHGNPLEYSCLENPKDRRAWQEYWSGLPCPPPGDLPNPGITFFSSMNVFMDSKV